MRVFRNNKLKYLEAKTIIGESEKCFVYPFEGSDDAADYYVLGLHLIEDNEDWDEVFPSDNLDVTFFE